MRRNSTHELGVSGEPRGESRVCGGRVLASGCGEFYSARHSVSRNQADTAPVEGGRLLRAGVEVREFIIIQRHEALKALAARFRI